MTLNLWHLFFYNHSVFNIENIVFLFLILVLFVIYTFWWILQMKPAVINNQLVFTKQLNTLIQDIAQAKMANHGFTRIYIMILFFFIALSNWIGLISYGYTITAVVILPFILSITAFVIPNYAGYKKFNIIFLSFFKPSGITWMLKPMLILIEIISHMIRTLSLAVRLFANMFAGHVLIYILSSTLLLALANPWVPGLGGLILNVIYLIIYSLETFIAVLQAYVFTALVGIYFTETMDH